MTLIKCLLERYYNEGVSLALYRDFLDAIYFLRPYNQMTYFKEKPKKIWEIKSIRENLGALGFLEMGVDTDYPTISSRGKSLHVSKKMADIGILSKNNLEIFSKYILLKSICDVDWNCFLNLLYHKWIQNEKPLQIHQEYYRYDKLGNWRHRWGFHNKIINEIGLNLIVKRLNLNNIDDFKNKLNPYATSFNFNHIFQQNLLLPSKEELINQIYKSIDTYKIIYPEDKPIGYTEVLKSIIYIHLLAENQFINEADLSLIFSLQLNNINIYRSSKPIKNIGRGFFYEGERLTYYPFFDI
jgi:hypothetical protein